MTDSFRDYLAAHEALRRLQARLNDGDFEAAESIAKIGNLAAELLAFESSCSHPESRAFQTVREVAEHSTDWPVMIPAVKELREPQIPARVPESLGAALPIKVKPPGRKGRALDKPGQTRMALELFHSLEARRSNAGHFSLGEAWEAEAAKLPPFSIETIEQWAEVAREALVMDFMRKTPILTVIPKKLTQAGKKRQAKHTISDNSALRTDALSWIKAGFEQLAKSDHSGE